jgi:CheY-like chemotaxis protein
MFTPETCIEPAILLAEDQQNDVLLMQLAMERAGLDNPLFAVDDGEAVVNYLCGNPPYSNRNSYPLPALLLLDLKMPRLDGFGVLAWLQQRPQFAHIGTVILSSSSLESDILRARSLGADDYLVKPNNNSDLAEIMISLHSHWLSSARQCA